MKTVIHTLEHTLVRQMEVVPIKGDVLLIHEPPEYTTEVKKIDIFKDYNYCKHLIEARTLHMYDDHMEADLLIGKCNRQDKCILDIIAGEG